MVSRASSYVTFTLDGHPFALPLSSVRSTVRAAWTQPLPGAPAVVQGVINLRGEAVAVVNLRARFGLPQRPLEPSDHFIIVNAGGRTLALTVDRVHDVVSRGATEIGSTTDVWPGLDCFDGVLRMDADVVLIHDLSRLLELEEARDLDNALRAAPAPDSGDIRTESP